MYEDLFKTSQNQQEAFDRLVSVIRALRAPGGCPWDIAQTHDSLRRGMVEECYEVVDAIEKKDIPNLREELGDVLLQVIMHSVIAEEEGEFTLADVCEEESEKMLRRHPHVFGENVEKYNKNGTFSVDNVLDLWENVKRDEKQETAQTASMEKIPRDLPALLRAEKVQKKARKVGFDWDDVSEAFAKVDEETAELRDAFSDGDKAHIKEELGDLLFAVVNVARFLDVDPEDALNSTSRKFIDRFSYIEKTAAANGRRLEDMTLAEMDALWEEAKEKNRK